MRFFWILPGIQDQFVNAAELSLTLENIGTALHPPVSQKGEMQPKASDSVPSKHI